jgi:hypothetical protein
MRLGARNVKTKRNSACDLHAHNGNRIGSARRVVLNSPQTHRLANRSEHACRQGHQHARSKCIPEQWLELHKGKAWHRGFQPLAVGGGLAAGSDSCT